MDSLPCPYASCGRGFSTLYNRRKHVEACHLKLRPFVCTRCQKTFPYKHSLNYHVRLHTREDQAAQSSVTLSALHLLTKAFTQCELRDLDKERRQTCTGCETIHLPPLHFAP